MTKSEKEQFIMWHEHTISRYPDKLQWQLRINRNKWLGGVKIKNEKNES